MPTEYIHMVEVTGSPHDLEKFHADDEIWSLDPWRALFDPHLREGTPLEGRLVYRYSDDYKRPGPDILVFSEKYPMLTFIHEGLDEFASVAWRAIWRGGERVMKEDVRALDLEWVEWEDE